MTILSNSLVTMPKCVLHMKEMMRMNDDDSRVDYDGDGLRITMVMWAKMEKGRTTRWLRMIIRMMMWETLTIPICATGRRWGRERMTTWLTTGEEERWGTENNGTAVNKYTCGGAAQFSWAVFCFASLGCLHIWQEYNLFLFSICLYFKSLTI